MIIYVDIDDTICHKASNYSEATPNYKNIKKVNNLYEMGHTIVMWTARGTLTNINWFQITTQQLQQWKVCYHELRMGKPAFDLMIDDRALNSLYHWNLENVNKILDPKQIC